MNVINLYHGSFQKVTMPMYGVGKLTNDYGQGFYCTEHIDLAKEWAVSENKDGYANHYQIDLDKLKILNLNELGTLEWLAILVDNRIVRINYPIMKKSMEWLKENYLPNISEYDLLIGYRADDSYFAFVRDFLSNTISLEQLESAMRLGELGEQYVLKSKKAFLEMRYIDAEVCNHDTYYALKKDRDNAAKKRYQKILEESSLTGTYIFDLMKK